MNFLLQVHQHGNSKIFNKKLQDIRTEKQSAQKIVFGVKLLCGKSESERHRLCHGLCTEMAQNSSGGLVVNHALCLLPVMEQASS